MRNYPYLDALTSQEYMELANVFNKENYLYNKKQYPYGPDEYDGKWSPLFSETDRLNPRNTNWKDYVLKSGSEVQKREEFDTDISAKCIFGHTGIKYGSFLVQVAASQIIPDF